MLKRTKTYTSSKTNANLPLVIVNPKSAGGDTKNKWAGVASDLRVHFGAFQVAFTKSVGNASEIAKNAAENGRKFIIACGGDGTINEVANGILQSEKSEVELGVFPSGTGGDFRRTIGLPSEQRKAAKVLREGITKTIDVGKVTFRNHIGAEESRYFLNVASFGLSASIGERVKENNFLKWLPFGNTIKGKAKFAFSTLQEVLEIAPHTVKIKVDDKEESSIQTLNFCICNARFFGGGMKIAPNAKINDGHFDIVNIGDINTARILLNGYKLYNGSHLQLPEVKSTLAKKIRVSTTDETTTINIETDGELPGKLPATFEILPEALKIRVPKT